MRITTRIATIGAAALLLGACGEGALEGTPEADALTAEGAALPEELRGATEDDLLAEVGRRVPGFGGMMLDDQGQLVVHVAAAAPLAEAHPDVLRRAISAVFGGERTAGGVRIERAPYSFLELKGWHDRVWQAVFAHPGVVMTDVDEARNRLRIGLEPGVSRERVAQALERAGVPAAAALIEEMAPIVEVATLQQSVRPLAGGLQIAFSNFLCTLGFNAARQGVNGFVTNSHCSDTRGAVTPTQYYQPLNAAANHIGVETTDPPFIMGGVCPGGRRCRYSDTIFARRDAGVTATVGAIERTTALGSITIAGAYRVVSEGSVATNTTLNKVGRTTGWTRGPVTSTCSNVGVSGSNIVMLCQGLVTAGVGAGDSGSPVFQVVNSPATNDIRFVGILWGGGGGQFVYSPIANIQRTGELGTLTNCAAGFSC